MARYSMNSCSGAWFGAAAMVAVSVWIAPNAQASQPYSCICKGQMKHYNASTHYCEHVHKVKSCTRAQFRSTYSQACREMGCRLPPG